MPLWKLRTIYRFLFTRLACRKKTSLLIDRSIGVHIWSGYRIPRRHLSMLYVVRFTWANRWDTSEISWVASKHSAPPFPPHFTYTCFLQPKQKSILAYLFDISNIFLFKIGNMVNVRLYSMKFRRLFIYFNVRREKTIQALSEHE